jgi:hypothetical protein
VTGPGLVVLVTASRTWRSSRDMGVGPAFGYIVERFAPHLLTQGDHGPRMDWGQVLVRHGAARGGDRHLARCATAWGMQVKSHPVTTRDWATCTPGCRPGHRRRRQDGQEYCPDAGGRRNQDMVDLGADVCLGFPWGPSRSGTRDCMTRATQAGIPVVDWPTVRAGLGI